MPFTTRLKLTAKLSTKQPYVVIGIDLEEKKDVLGIWIGENESAKFWFNGLNELKNRGVKDILIISVDNLSGIRGHICLFSKNPNPKVHNPPNKKFHQIYIYILQGFKKLYH